MFINPFARPWCRKLLRPAVTAVLSTMLIATPACGVEVALNESFHDLEGNTHLGAPVSYVATVVVFMNVDCPIANAYQPTLKRIKEDFGDQFDYVFVYANTELSREEAIKHREKFDITWHQALDPEGLTQERLDARVSPEAFLLGPKNEILYRGRIDDLFAAYGKKRSMPTTSDLRVAMQSVIEHKPITVRETTAVGCKISHRKNVDSQ